MKGLNVSLVNVKIRTASKGGVSKPTGVIKCLLLLQSWCTHDSHILLEFEITSDILQRANVN